MKSDKVRTELSLNKNDLNIKANGSLDSFVMQNDKTEDIHKLSGQESRVLETISGDKRQCLLQAIMRQNASVQEATQNRLLLRLHITPSISNNNWELGLTEGPSLLQRGEQGSNSR